MSSYFLHLSYDLCGNKRGMLPSLPLSFEFCCSTAIPNILFVHDIFPTIRIAEGSDFPFGNQIIESGILDLARGLLNVNHLNHRHLSYPLMSPCNKSSVEGYRNIA